jgi:hypothetical protein
VNGYANLIAARLRKLAEEGSTGMLPVSGRGDGAVFFHDGQVVYAESSRTSLPALRTSGLAAPALAHGDGHRDGHGPAGAAEIVPTRSVSRLTGLLELTELIIDALAELLSSESRYGKFRQDQVLPDGQGRPMAVEALLAEVQRRHEVQRRLAAVVTPDTPVARDPSLDPPSAQVSPAQWAVLARAGDRTTPRDLAVQQGRSVFGTTIEVYRLVELGLLVVPGRPPEPADEPDQREPGPALSFLRAVPGARGSDALRPGGDRVDRRGTAGDQAERAGCTREHHRHDRRPAGRARHARP